MAEIQQYKWVDVTASIGATTVEAISAIEYTAEQEIKTLYGRGNNPIYLAEGKRKYSGKLTIAQSELEALQIASGAGNNVLDLTFNVTLVYERLGALVTDIWNGCKAMKIPKSIGVDDTTMVVELELEMLAINYNV